MSDESSAGSSSRVLSRLMRRRIYHKTRVALGKEKPRWKMLRESVGCETDSEFAKLLLDSFESLLSYPPFESGAGARSDNAAYTGQKGGTGSVKGNLTSCNKRIVNKRVRFGPLNMECSSDSDTETASEKSDGKYEFIDIATNSFTNDVESPLSNERIVNKRVRFGPLNMECLSDSETETASEKSDGKYEFIDVETKMSPINTESPLSSDSVCKPVGLDASHLDVGHIVSKNTKDSVNACTTEDPNSDTTNTDPNSECMNNSDSVKSKDNDNDDNRCAGKTAETLDYNTDASDVDYISDESDVDYNPDASDVEGDENYDYGRKHLANVDNAAEDSDFKPEACEKNTMRKKDKRKVHKRQLNTRKYFTLNDGKNTKCGLKYQPYLEVITEPCSLAVTSDRSESSALKVCFEKLTNNVSTKCPLKMNPCKEREFCMHLSVDDGVKDKDRIPDMVERPKPAVRYRCTACGYVLQNLSYMKRHITLKEIASDSDYELESDESSEYSDNDFESMKKIRLKVKTRKPRPGDFSDSTVSSDGDKNDINTKAKEVSRKDNPPIKSKRYFFLDDGKNSRCSMKFRPYLGVVYEPSALSLPCEDPKSSDTLTDCENVASNVSCEFLTKGAPTDKEDDSKLLVKDQICTSNLESNEVVAKTKARVKYQCLACGQTSISLHIMKKHISLVEIYDPQVCLYCGEVLPNTYMLSVHEAKHNEKETKSHFMNCTYEGCSRKVKNTKQMKRHISAVHLNERKHVCSWADCEKRFNSSHALEVHMRIHTDSKPLICYLCGYQCRQKASLNWHMKTKHPEAAVF